MPRTSPAPVLRPAEPADLPRIAAAWEAAWLDGHRGRVPDELMAARDSRHFTTFAADHLSTTVVATDGGTNLLGLVIVGTGDGEVIQLAVDRAARGAGVGSALLHAAERMIAKTNQEAWLAVVPANTTARRLYERAGWHDAGPVLHRAPTRQGTVPVPVHRYVKTVRPGAADNP
ncbi:GNAT family N-acetyltransferase [Amycolatopsis orientalis]|uniref:GNAT family N-acetyltransferase n=1 Tax=Amycolatopsis orientalis TaxID=31958 RepID=UPI00039FD681|nr:N-acetyltransferase [Amycolatopsis orientalis]